MNQWNISELEAAPTAVYKLSTMVEKLLARENNMEKGRELGESKHRHARQVKCNHVKTGKTVKPTIQMEIVDEYVLPPIRDRCWETIDGAGNSEEEITQFKTQIYGH